MFDHFVGLALKWLIWMQNTQQTKTKIKKKDVLEEGSSTIKEQNNNNKKGLLQFSASMDKIASVQMKKHKLSLESDLKHGEIFLKFKQDGAKKNREHELEMAKT